MIPEFDFWRMLAGISLFLFAMLQIEAALKILGGRSLYRFLQRHTDRRLKAVGGGIVATAFLQSSSVVGLMVLAFVGAGLLSLPNALGIIFGSNLGTTLTGWIVVTLGFRFEIFELALPLIATGGVLALIGKDRTHQVGRIIIGLGLLLLGLQFMKDSVTELRDSIDAGSLAGMAAWRYMLFGIVVAAIIQSSSATMMITLAALHAGMISLPDAVVIVIGANLGTSSTVLIGAINGSSAKQQVATGHLIFNTATAIVAYAILPLLLVLIVSLGITDPLYALVAFHSLFNMLGLCLFMPLTGPFAALLQRMFTTKAEPEAHYFREISPQVSDAALGAIDKETAHLIRRVIRQNLTAFSPPLPLPPGRLPVSGDNIRSLELSGRFEDLYAATKQLEGEILEFAIELQRQRLDEAQSQRLNQLVAAVREAVQSAKFLKDIRHNLDEFYESNRQVINNYLDHFRTVMTSFYGEVFALRRNDDDGASFEDLVEILQHEHDWHDQMHSQIHSDVSNGSVKRTDISSLLNVNREILHSNLALLMALTHYHLEEGQVQAFMRLPGGS